MTLSAYVPLDHVTIAGTAESSHVPGPVPVRECCLIGSLQPVSDG